MTGELILVCELVRMIIKRFLISHYTKTRGFDPKADRSNTDPFSLLLHGVFPTDFKFGLLEFAATQLLPVRSVTHNLSRAFRPIAPSDVWDSYRSSLSLLSDRLQKLAFHDFLFIKDVVHRKAKPPQLQTRFTGVEKLHREVFSTAENPER